MDPLEGQPRFFFTRPLNNAAKIAHDPLYPPSPLHRYQKLSLQHSSLPQRALLGIVVVMSPPNLESLPLDVAYNILSHLYQGPQLKHHSYLTLSAVSKTLNGLIEAYSAHLLAARRARFPKAKNPPLQKGRNRQKLLHQIWNYCEFCNKKSTRRAILAPLLICCKKCDQDEWPTKITMTDACKRYHLKQPDLFGAKIRYGQYYGVTGLTTLFLEHEVREVATRVHAGPGGDLAVYLALRASQSVERKAKQEEAREAKKAHLRRALIANGFPSPALVTRLSPLLFPVHNQRPAMTVLEIVRMQILEQRLETEMGYRQSAHVQTPSASYLAWETGRLWDTRLIDTERRIYSHTSGGQEQPKPNLNYNQINDFRDKALFEMFCKEFDLFPEYHHDALEGGHESAKEMERERQEGLEEVYELHRDMWKSVSDVKRALEMPKQTIIASGRRQRWESTIFHSNAPWSWKRYPILIKDVMAEDPEPVATSTGVGPEDLKKVADKAKERKKIEKWNAGAEKEIERIAALIKEKKLDMQRWCKLKKPHYEVEEVEAADALQVLREGGREIIVLD